MIEVQENDLEAICKIFVAADEKASLGVAIIFSYTQAIKEGKSIKDAVEYALSEWDV